MKKIWMDGQMDKKQMIEKKMDGWMGWLDG